MFSLTLKLHPNMYIMYNIQDPAFNSTPVLWIAKCLAHTVYLVSSLLLSSILSILDNSLHSPDSS